MNADGEARAKVSQTKQVAVTSSVNPTKQGKRKWTQAEALADERPVNHQLSPQGTVRPRW